MNEGSQHNSFLNTIMMGMHHGGGNGGGDGSGGGGGGGSGGGGGAGGLLSGSGNPYGPMTGPILKGYHLDEIIAQSKFFEFDDAIGAQISKILFFIQAFSVTFGQLYGLQQIYNIAPQLSKFNIASQFHMPSMFSGGKGQSH